MSAFEITVTPSRLKQKKRAEGREPAVVVMAPFSAKAIVQFEDVPITKTARRQVRVLNPSDDDIEVKVMKAIREEHNLSLEWMEHTVPARDEVSMELVWSPVLEVACKETLQLVDNRNFRKEVMIILKSKSNQPVKNPRKFPTVGKTLQLKSPTGAGKTMKSVVSAAVQQKRRMSAAAAPPTKQPWRAPLVEKNVYKTPKEEPVYISPQPRSLKENLSPMTPGNLLDVIDNLRFTPLTETRGKEQATILPDNLAAWPTPTLKGNVRQCANDMRPRRITPDDLEDQPATNKTFDVKHSETINISLDTLDCSRIDGQPHTPLNKTTTIVHATHTRALACIHEEEGPSPPRTPTKSAIHDLKRDIKLVGSPLRKYSESMKDLSLLSPQTKYAIQGSMPNLNEMKIRSIEQNRYYQEQQIQIKAKDLNSSSSSEASLAGQQEFLFNHSEILAQSSRFNLHEVGRKSVKGSPVKNPHKRRSHELSFSDAPSNESLYRNETIAISPPKKQRVEDTTLPRSAAPANASARSSSAHAWPHAQSKKFKLAQTMSLMKKPATPRKARETSVQPSVKLYDSELYMQTCINPDPFAATTTIDPFLASTMYLDEQAVDRHQADFKKWLNALVSIPADLDADLNNKIDVGKLFNEVRNKELVVAPTKEEQSMNYLTKYRLETLRKAAVELFFSEQMRKRYRMRQQMIQDRNAYLRTRQCIINVQRRWRATLQMRQERKNYLQLQSTTKLIQIKFRAKREMEKQRAEFLELKKVTLVVQQRRRALLQMRKERQEYLHLREVAIKLQRRFHAQKSMRFIRAKYRGTQAAVSCLQMHWRSHLLRKRERNSFLQLRKAAITLQRRYRARLSMIKQLKSYAQLKHAATTTQTRYRAKKAMQKQVVLYQKQREAIIKVQRRYRGKLEMRRQIEVYQKQRQAVIRLQKWWRSIRDMRLCKAGYRRIRLSSLSIQRKWRATVQARRQREIFLSTIRKVRLMQAFIRATLLMRQQRREFETKRVAAIVLQRRFRARCAMLKARQDYQLIQSSVILVQRKFRANRSMKQARQEFVHLRTITVHLQQKFRGKRLMIEQRNHKRN
ncbi:GD21126 [Drosophila simulans]|uniref:GD21126 n=1 Tax=Drosophila simulans TaxID=7240 RepID=B4QTR5_DROSI|nr:GD21126 [Drosophila simulans]